jgi:hypothetical protein
MEIPVNSKKTNNDKSAKTLRACFVVGSWKFGTALLTASTPVKAVQPEEKALKINNNVMGSTTPYRKTTCG